MKKLITLMLGIAAFSAFFCAPLKAQGTWTNLLNFPNAYYQFFKFQSESSSIFDFTGQDIHFQGIDNYGSYNTANSTFINPEGVSYPDSSNKNGFIDCGGDRFVFGKDVHEIHGNGLPFIFVDTINGNESVLIRQATIDTIAGTPWVCFCGNYTGIIVTSNNQHVTSGGYILYEPVSKMWKTISNMQNCYGVSAQMFQGNLFMTFSDFDLGNFYQVRRYDGTNTYDLPSDAYNGFVVATPSKMVVAGEKLILATGGNGGGLSILSFDGTVFSSLGNINDANSIGGIAYDSATNCIYPYGAFNDANGIASLNIVKISLTTGLWTSMGSGAPGWGVSHAEIHNGKVYVSGPTFRVYDESTGIVSPFTEQFSIGPNPVIDQLNFSWTENEHEISITNSIGQSVLHQKLSGLSNEINISSLTPGVYILYIKKPDGQQTTFKVVKD